MAKKGKITVEVAPDFSEVVGKLRAAASELDGGKAPLVVEGSKVFAAGVEIEGVMSIESHKQVNEFDKYVIEFIDPTRVGGELVEKENG